jgi:hypothetical protein
VLGCSLPIEIVAQEWITQHAAEFSRASLN